jgi:CBS domain-containing protein
MEEQAMLAHLKINDLMTHDVISVSSGAKLSAAQQIMQEFGIRHLPVVDHGKLVGIISKGDIREAKPSDASTLTVWEANYLWDRIEVREVMTKQVVTVEGEQPFVDALKVMVARKFSSLPVVREGVLVGILTETDIFNKLIALAEAELAHA